MDIFFECIFWVGGVWFVSVVWKCLGCVVDKYVVIFVVVVIVVVGVVEVFDSYIGEKGNNVWSFLFVMIVNVVEREGVVDVVCVVELWIVEYIYCY